MYISSHFFTFVFYWSISTLSCVALSHHNHFHEYKWKSSPWGKLPFKDLTWQCLGIFQNYVASTDLLEAQHLYVLHLKLTWVGGVHDYVSDRAQIVNNLIFFIFLKADRKLNVWICSEP